MDCIGLGQVREIGKLGGKRPLSRPRRKWDDIILIDILKVCCGSMDYFDLGQGWEMGKLCRKRPLSRPRLKRNDINVIDHQNVG